jgi:MarR family transcriptional regulator, organic hydroperoxide resistance regulator
MPPELFVKTKRSPKTRPAKTKAPRPADILPPRLSSGYLVRDAHRAFQRLLERRIAPYGVTRGQWYFLRVLWNADGLSQRELSARVGMMEPTTVIALRSMERSQLIRRLRAEDDRRKVRVFLTAKAKRLRNQLLTLARDITAEAEEGIGPRDIGTFRRVITRMTANLDRIAD